MKIVIATFLFAILVLDYSIKPSIQGLGSSKKETAELGKHNLDLLSKMSNVFLKQAKTNDILERQRERLISASKKLDKKMLTIEGALPPPDHRPSSSTSSGRRRRGEFAQQALPYHEGNAPPQPMSRLPSGGSNYESDIESHRSLAGRSKSSRSNRRGKEPLPPIDYPGNAPPQPLPLPPSRNFDQESDIESHKSLGSQRSLRSRSSRLQGSRSGRRGEEVLPPINYPENVLPQPLPRPPNKHFDQESDIESHKSLGSQRSLRNKSRQLQVSRSGRRGEEAQLPPNYGKNGPSEMMPRVPSVHSNYESDMESLDRSLRSMGIRDEPEGSKRSNKQGEGLMIPPPQRREIEVKSGAGGSVASLGNSRKSKQKFVPEYDFNGANTAAAHEQAPWSPGMSSQLSGASSIESTARSKASSKKNEERQKSREQSLVYHA